MWVCAFCLWYAVLGAYVDTKDSFPIIIRPLAVLIQTFENSIGNIGNPSYVYWLKILKNESSSAFEKNVSMFTIYVIWFIWISN